MRHVLILVLALALHGCATSPVERGKELIAQGRIEEGLAVLEEAAKERYRHPEAYSTWLTQRDRIVRALIREGDARRTAGDLDAAEAAYARALQIAPDSTLAQNGLNAVAQAHRHAARMEEAEAAYRRGDIADAEALALSVLTQASFSAGACVLVLEASGVPDVWQALAVVPLALLSIYLPTFAGFGTREAAFAFALAPAGVSEVQATAASLAFGAAHLCVALVGGVLHGLRRVQ